MSVWPYKREMVNFLAKKAQASFVPLDVKEVAREFIKEQRMRTANFDDLLSSVRERIHITLTAAEGYTWDPLLRVKVMFVFQEIVSDDLKQKFSEIEDSCIIYNEKSRITWFEDEELILGTPPATLRILHGLDKHLLDSMKAKSKMPKNPFNNIQAARFIDEFVAYHSPHFTNKKVEARIPYLLSKMHEFESSEFTLLDIIQVLYIFKRAVCDKLKERIANDPEVQVQYNHKGHISWLLTENGLTCGKFDQQKENAARKRALREENEALASKRQKTSEVSSGASAVNSGGASTSEVPSTLPISKGSAPEIHEDTENQNGSNPDFADFGDVQNFHQGWAQEEYQMEPFVIKAEDVKEEVLQMEDIKPNLPQPLPDQQKIRRYQQKLRRIEAENRKRSDKLARRDVKLEPLARREAQQNSQLQNVSSPDRNQDLLPSKAKSSGTSGALEALPSEDRQLARGAPSDVPSVTLVSESPEISTTSEVSSTSPLMESADQSQDSSDNSVASTTLEPATLETFHDRSVQAIAMPSTPSSNEEAPSTPESSSPSIFDSEDIHQTSFPADVNLSQKKLLSVITSDAPVISSPAVMAEPRKTSDESTQTESLTSDSVHTSSEPSQPSKSSQPPTASTSKLPHPSSPASICTINLAEAIGIMCHSCQSSELREYADDRVRALSSSSQTTLIYDFYETCGLVFDRINATRVRNSELGSILVKDFLQSLLYVAVFFAEELEGTGLEALIEEKLNEKDVDKFWIPKETSDAALKLLLRLTVNFV